MKIKKRLLHIDLLESIAIFFVILYHSTIYNYDIIKNNSLFNYFLYFGRAILSTCVPLFFFTNGYLLFNKEFDLKKHIKKIIRLIILIIIWAFILIILYMKIEGEQLRIKTILMSILTLDVKWSMNLFWFLGALISIYIIFPCLKKNYDFDKKSFVFFTIVCAFLSFGFVFGNQIILLIGTIIHHDIPSLNFPLLTIFNPFRGSYGYSFVYFCIGGLMYEYESKILTISKIKRNIVSIIGIMVCTTLLFFLGVFYTKKINGVIWDVVWNGYDSIFTFFNVIFIYVLCLNYNNNNYFIKNISCNSLGIFFIHELIIRLTQPWLKKQYYLCNLPFNVIYAFLILVVCNIICLILRKLPLLKK